MAKNNYLFYSYYLKTRNTENKSIMIAKTKKSYLIGPIIDITFIKIRFIEELNQIVYIQQKYIKRCLRKNVIHLLKNIKMN